MPEADVLPLETEAALQPAADAPTESGSTDAPATDTASAGEAVSNESPESKPAKTFTQEQLDEIVQRERARAQRKAQREADQRLAEAIKQAQTAPSSAPKETPSKPKVEDFSTTEEYVEAAAAWQARQIVRETLTEAEASRQAATKQAQQLEQRKQWEAAVEKAEDKYEDFHEVAYNPRVPISDPMAQLIQASDVGPDLAYFFGKNMDEAARIAQLDPMRAAKEIGKLEIKLSEAKDPKPVSKASPPINPLRGSGSSIGVELSDRDSDADWLKKRNAQVAAKMKARRLPT